MSKVIVIGGGAAGMMAAAAAAQKGHSVLLLEKNEKLGKKVYITGKGRCNVTNACGVQELFDNVVTNPRFLYSAIYGFDNVAVQDFFEKRGCPLKVERGNRVFPVSDHSSDIIRTLERELARLGVDVRLKTPVKRILADRTEGEKPRVTGAELLFGEKLSADAVILACGGLSYPATGSTGDGYRMAQELGHTRTALAPSLVPFVIREDWCPALQGLALKNVEAALVVDGKEIYRGFGEMLFTHFGVSGPLILSASSYYQRELARLSGKKGKRKDGKRAAGAESGGKAAPLPETGRIPSLEPAPSPEACLLLDLKPALTREQLDKRILRDFEASRNRQFKNAVDGLFPARLIPVMLRLSGIDPEKKVNEITREERKQFVELIKSVRLTVNGTRGFEEAVITRGGIPVKEVNPSTMGSRLAEGLYLAGEMLDLDALTGGFNLQIAWSTGWLAGSSV